MRMLLRSSSNPVLDSFIGHQAESELNSTLRRCRSVHTRNQLHALTDDGNGRTRVDSTIKRVQSDTDLNPKLSIGPSNPWARRSKNYGSSGLDNFFDMEFSLEDVISNTRLDESTEEEDTDNDSVIGYGSFNQLTSMGSRSSDRIASQKNKKVGFNEMEFEASGVAALVAHKSENELEYVYSDGGNGYGNGDGSGVGGGGGYGSSGSDSNSIDAYYQRMLQANPDNPLLMRNYARFLHEVQHDLKKAEEYYGRTILASPCDGDALSLYAKLIWDVDNDAPRAESYFDRAVEAAPDDCYVLGSYANFLWNAGDEEEDATMKPKNTPTEFFGTVVTAS